MKVTLHTPDTIYAKRHTLSWFSLAGAAGTVNGIAFVTCEQFVSHITGTATRMGLEWRHILLSFEYLLILLSFIAGATASVMWIQARAYGGKSPRWATPLIAVAAILVGTAMAGHLGLFGTLAGHVAADPPPSIFLSVLAFAMGLQNAAVASTTGLAVRTTHLTGPATDLGIHLGTAWFASGEDRRAALKGAVLRGGKVVSFIIGAALSLPLTHAFGFLALLAAAGLVSFAALLSFVPNWSPSDFPFKRPQSASKDAADTHTPGSNEPGASALLVNTCGRDGPA
jgi:uncharacterized membrane protein YoaK (UPF0700 family)